MDSKDFEEMCYQFMALKYEESKAEGENNLIAYNKGCVATRAAFEKAYIKYNRRFKPNASQRTIT